MTITTRLHQVQARIARAEQLYQRRPGSVMLVAVSKTRSIADIQAAYGAGQRRFGENYVREALPKIMALADLDIEWHFIGAIQSNKTQDIARYFAWVHSLDNLRHAERLAQQRPSSLPPLNVCLQVNIDAEPQKAGVNLEHLPALALAVAALPHLKLRGLMTLPRPRPHLEAQRLPLRRLHDAYEQLIAAGLPLDTLSMGMSNDMEAAIAEGATIVRIGTDIFGPRPAQSS